MKQRIFSIVLCLLCLNALRAQQIDQNKMSTLTYDYSKDVLSGKIPFDDYFRIVFKGIKANEIYSVELFEVKYEKNSGSLIVKSNIKKDDYYPGIALSDVALRYQDLKISKNKENKGSSQSIVAPLDPERSYVMAIHKENSEINHLVFNEFLSLVTKPASVDEQIAFFDNHILSLQDNLDKVKIDFFSFSTEFDGFIKKIDPVLKFYKDSNNHPTINNLSLDPAITGTVITTVAQYFKPQDIDNPTFKQVVPMFLNSETSKINSFSSGNTSSTQPHDYAKKISNLKANIALLEKLKAEVEALQLVQNDTNINDFYSKFILKSLTIMKSNLTSMVKFNTDLKKEINKVVPELILISTTTLGSDIKVSNSQSLIPDVGILNAWGYNSDGRLKYIGRPYLGLNWHFSGINRSQYLREIPNEKFRHRWSLAVGITLGKIDTEDYEDFYNGISPTLGMNYRLTRQIRAGIGTLIVRQKRRNPLNDNSKVELAPYTSISFDLGLFNEASKLTKLVGF